MNNRGYSLGFTWIFGLVSLFGIGIIYITFDQVFVAHLVPIMKSTANNTVVTNIDATTLATINTNIDKYMAFWHALPFILFFIVILYMIIATVRREGDEQQF